MSPVPRSPGDPAVAIAVHLLLKTVQTLRMYPVTNEISQRALAELTPALLASLPLEVDVGVEHMASGGTALSEPDRSSLVNGMWRDGIRRLQVLAGIEAEEIRRLVLALATPLNPDDLSEDYVTLLWAADLRHVRVLAVDPYLTTDDLDEDVLEGREAPEPEPDEMTVPELASIPSPPKEAFLITEKHALRIAAEVERESASPPWDTFVDALLEVLEGVGGGERTPEAVQAIEACFQRLLKERRVELAAKLIRGAEQAKLPRSGHALLEAALARIADADRLFLLHEAIEAGECAPRAAASLLSLLQPLATEALCVFLGRAQSEETRRLYVEVLVDTGLPAVAPAIRHFRSGGPETRRAMSRVLGRLRDPAATDALLDALEGAGPGLRSAIVAALALIRDPKALTTLLEIALGDADLTTRKMALRGLGEARTQLDHRRLLARVRSRLLATLDEEEKDLLFNALAGIGRDDVVPYLRGLLRPSWFPGLRTRDDWRRAAMALARLGSPAALDVLKKFSRSRRAAVARICAMALNTVPAREQ